MLCGREKVEESVGGKTLIQGERGTELEGTVLRGEREMGRSDGQASPKAPEKIHLRSIERDSVKLEERGSNRIRRGLNWSGGRRPGLFSLRSAPLHPPIPQSRRSPRGDVSISAIPHPSLHPTRPPYGPSATAARPLD